jgi:hypothetical protein
MAASITAIAYHGYRWLPNLDPEKGHSEAIGKEPSSSNVQFMF